MIAQVFIAAAIAAASAAGAWNWQANKYERLLSDQRAEYLKRDFKALEVAHAETVRLRDKAQKALRNAEVRRSFLVAAVDRARTESVGLRSDLDAATRGLSDATCDSVRDHTATLAAVLRDLEAAGGKISEAADGHAFDSLTLFETLAESGSDFASSPLQTERPKPR